MTPLAARIHQYPYPSNRKHSYVHKKSNMGFLTPSELLVKLIQSIFNTKSHMGFLHARHLFTPGPPHPHDSSCFAGSGMATSRLIGNKITRDKLGLKESLKMSKSYFGIEMDIAPKMHILRLSTILC